VTGERHVIDPFLDRYPRNRKGEPQVLTSAGEGPLLKEMLGAVDHAAVSETLNWFVDASVRNTFAHADYTLHRDGSQARSLADEQRGLYGFRSPPGDPEPANGPGVAQRCDGVRALPRVSKGRRGRYRPARAIWRRADRTVPFADPF
jgi:hypothetical protein